MTIRTSDEDNTERRRISESKNFAELSKTKLGLMGLVSEEERIEKWRELCGCMTLSVFCQCFD